jgi:hypothetical protein
MNVGILIQDAHDFLIDNTAGNHIPALLWSPKWFISLLANDDMK